MRPTWSPGGPSAQNERSWHDDVNPEDERAGETDTAYWSRRVDELQARIRDDPPTDPALLERLQRTLAAAHHELERSQLDQHWSGGDGDRRLF